MCQAVAHSALLRQHGGFFICVPEDIESATKVEKISMSANAQRISWAGGVPDVEGDRMQLWLLLISTVVYHNYATLPYTSW